MLVDSPAGPVIDVGPRGFAALSLFSRPLALGDAIERLEADEHRGTDFLPTMSVINTLIEEGVLVGAGGEPGPHNRLGGSGRARPAAARRPQDE